MKTLRSHGLRLKMLAPTNADNEVYKGRFASHEVGVGEDINL